MYSKDKQIDALEYTDIYKHINKSKINIWMIKQNWTTLKYLSLLKLLNHVTVLYTTSCSVSQVFNHALDRSIMYVKNWWIELLLCDSLSFYKLIYDLFTMCTTTLLIQKIIVSLQNFSRMI